MFQTESLCECDKPKIALEKNLDVTNNATSNQTNVNANCAWVLCMSLMSVFQSGSPVYP